MKKGLAITLFCLMVACFPGIVFGGYTSCGTNCYYANSTSSVDVLSAIDAAEAASGGIVQIPAGSSIYTTGVAKMLTKDIKIVGSGQTSTVITDRTDNNTGSAFKFTINGNVRFELSNMKFISKTGLSPNGTLNIRGTSTTVIVHDMTFDMIGITGGRMVSWGSYNDTTQGGGVFYRCSWNNFTNTSQGIGLFGKAYPYWDGNPSWGSDKIKYIEDCTFNFTGGLADGAFDAYAGAKGVFRYNRVIGTLVGWHGNDSVKDYSAHSFEIYNNTFTSPTVRGTAIGIRGGTALIYNNSIDPNFRQTFTLGHYRGCASFMQSAFGWTSGWCKYGYPGDGSYDASGYLCKQQPGTSGADGLTNWPVIEWNNSHNGGTNNMSFAHNGNFIPPLCTSTHTQLDYVKEERDFINHSTCTDGIDNDDDGRTDMNDIQCATFWDNNLKIAKDYKPLVYPHPLTGLPAATSGTVPTNTTNTTTVSATTPDKTTISAITSTTKTTVTNNPSVKKIKKKVFNR